MVNAASQPVLQEKSLVMRREIAEISDKAKILKNPSKYR
jgi:hypothetical protein